MKTAFALALVLAPRLVSAGLFLQWEGTVAEVPDGNTLVIQVDGVQPGTNRTVTLDGIRVPSASVSAAAAARKRLEELVKGRQVRVEQTGGAGKAYGTWVIVKRSGQVVNLLLVQEGLAAVAAIRGTPPREVDGDPEEAAAKMAAAQAEAKRQGLGLWKKEEAEPAPPQ